MTPQPIIGSAIPHQPTPTEQQDGGSRLELHNSSVHEVLGEDGACAQVHLPTGRVCLLNHHDQGSCRFDAAPPEA